MNKHASANQLSHREPVDSEGTFDQFYSVEFADKNVNLLYQFKIWGTQAKTILVLVKEGSSILNRLKVGEVFQMKYYSKESFCPIRYFPTQITKIDKSEQGRFKNYYLVNMNVLIS